MFSVCRCVHQTRVKLFRLGGREGDVTLTGEGDTAAADGTKPAGKTEWVEVGTGPLKVLRSDSDSSSRIVMRRENTPGGIGTKLLLNVLLKGGHVKAIKQADRAVLFTCFENSAPASYLFKTKLVQVGSFIFFLILQIDF